LHYSNRLVYCALSIENKQKSLSYGSSVGPLATICREPGQAWKGAATATTSCAGMWLAELLPIFLSLCFIIIISMFIWN